MYCNPQFCCNFVYWVACKPAGPFSRRIIMSRTANPRRLCCISPVLKALSAHPPTHLLVLHCRCSGRVCFVGKRIEAREILITGGGFVFSDLCDLWPIGAINAAKRQFPKSKRRRWRVWGREEQPEMWADCSCAAPPCQLHGQLQLRLPVSSLCTNVTWNPREKDRKEKHRERERERIGVSIFLHSLLVHLRVSSPVHSSTASPTFWRRIVVKTLCTKRRIKERAFVMNTTHMDWNKIKTCRRPAQKIGWPLLVSRSLNEINSTIKLGQ